MPCEFFWQPNFHVLPMKRQAVEAPEGPLKDRYDLLLRPCDCTVYTVHLSTFEDIKLIDWVHLYHIIFQVSHFSSHLQPGRPFLPLKSFAGGQSFVKRRGRSFFRDTNQMEKP